ncbi:hypothetical protein HYQ45_005862 [Verticillium longisporum]|uniref:Uncharacterized protein n=2 Tax=Verticillium TaxID=1036719 RepID=A0A0G4MJM2_VERLO|nr:hypothetical protein HYQ44_009727 [Verticillium longisporum]KAG7136702.1 hypothetical protein HYQ45_005862 [Verticillium longisporum]RXG45751.1 hypothetical protein VDGE_30430 [Verticillium dahliae]CRK34322.1 hypothetical protein BN1723_004011 [Verticillium longisporum]
MSANSVFVCGCVRGLGICVSCPVCAGSPRLVADCDPCMRSGVVWHNPHCHAPAAYTRAPPPAPPQPGGRGPRDGHGSSYQSVPARRN